MKPEIQALVTSAIRWAIAFAAGYVGVEVVQDQVNTVAAVVATVAIAAVSLWWSKASDAAQIKKVTGQ